MRRLARLRRHISYANCCATLALFVALSTGGAYAKSNLIDGRTIKPNSVPASALQNNSVTGAKIKNQQLTAADVKKGSLTPTVFNSNTQKQLESIGSGVVGGGGDTGGTCSDRTSPCSPVDVVPTGVDQPCHFLGDPKMGVWKEPAPGFWLCTIDLGNGVTSTIAPAKAGKYSGAVNG